MTGPRALPAPLDVESLARAMASEALAEQAEHAAVRAAVCLAVSWVIDIACVMCCIVLLVHVLMTNVLTPVDAVLLAVALVAKIVSGPLDHHIDVLANRAVSVHDMSVNVPDEMVEQLVGQFTDVRRRFERRTSDES